MTVRRVLRTAARRGRDERGGVLVITAVAIVAMLAMAAFAIDVGSWYQVQRQVQSAADAAALAGAQDLPTSQATATTDADSYVSTNLPGAGTPSVTFPSSTQIKVTITTTAPSSFGKLLGVTSATISATSVAQETPGVTACATPGVTCDAIWTSDTNCGTAQTPNYGVTFNGSGDIVLGGVHSNGSIDLVGGSQQLGPTTYGNGANCKVTQGGSGDTFSSGPTAGDPVVSWPMDYSTIFTACGGTGQVSCTGPGGTPSYCTQAAANFNFPTNPIATDNVYCAYGTGTPSTPSTWNGLIYFVSGTFGTSTTPLYGTWIGGTIEVGRKSFLSPQASTPTYPVFYAIGSGNCSTASNGGVCMTASGSGVNGAIFAPNGTVEFNGAGGTSNFLEAKDVNLVGGSFTGDGPLTSSTGSSTSGSSALLQ